MSRFPVRYAGWMARDLALGPGVPVVGLTLLVTLFLTSAQIETNLVGGLQAILVWALDLTMWIVTLLATTGIVSADRAGGYHRTLFAHPVSPPLFYLQRWLLGGALVLAASAITAAALAARLQAPAVWFELVMRAGLVYLVFGGLVLFCSTLVRRDWLLAFGILAAHAVLGVLISGPVARALDALLPPVGLLLPGRDLPAGSNLLYVVLYGVALIAAAMVIIRRRPLASGARE
jgi:ABC-type transport system involved in multi-copper enzyme maturation permease subunit